MNSKIYVGEMMHLRVEPVKHAFNYPVYLFAFDLDELKTLDKTVPFFGYNRFRPISIHDKDYLKGEGSIREKLMRFLTEKGCADSISRVTLVTTARYFNHAFNPVSFYYCYRPDGSLRVAVAEVNNTFKERHLYILEKAEKDAQGFLARYKTPKQFHVSPFFDRKGEYDFSLSSLGETVDIRIDLHRDGKAALLSRITGKARPLTAQNLLKVLVRFPLSALLTLPRIHWQAAKLFFLKKLPVQEKPTPSDPLTIRLAPPTLFQKLSMTAILKFLSCLEHGFFSITLPDGSRREFGDPASDHRSALQVRSYRFFSRLLLGGDIGFGESYMDEDWDSEDLTGLLKVFIKNEDIMNDTVIKFAWIGRLVNRLTHLSRKNTLLGSKKNIEAHYDLSNDFFKTFLDPTLMYSSAVFESQSQSLEAAQVHKLHTIIRKARITKEDHVLEIGSGWGSFAIEAVKQTGCRVTSITLSKEQLRLAEERVRKAGLSDRIEFKICDYRHVTGSFDKIVSIEMLEAVGHENFGTFFKVCEERLKPNGLCVIQVITISDQRYEVYRDNCDWIQKHIFPGGTLPSLTVLSQAMTQHSRLIVEDLENIGIHYARTLREWRERFLANITRVEELGFDRKFQRKWVYYLSYCEAGFAARILHDIHLVLTRPSNRILGLE